MSSHVHDFDIPVARASRPCVGASAANVASTGGTPVPRERIEPEHDNFAAVDIWHVRLMQIAPSACLSADERDRADGFKFERDRIRFVACRSALREVLAEYLGLSPRDVAFSYGSYGKPYIEGCEIRFNVSHSGDDALIAVTRGREVGIDIERLDARLDPEQLGRRYLTPAEWAFVGNTRSDKRLEAFLGCWTRKEAWAKAVGPGIAGGLSQFDTSESLNRATGLLRDRAGGDWLIVELKQIQGLIGAIAVQGNQTAVSYHTFG
jgi:4'-phosphopantetheinyl transferase